VTEPRGSSILGGRDPGTDGSHAQDDDEPQPPRRARWVVLLVAFALVVATAIALAIPRLRAAELAVSGLEDGAVLNANAVEALEVVIDTSGMGAGEVAVTLDGESVEPALVVDPATGEELVVVRPAAVDDGEHSITVTMAGRFGAAAQTVARRFSVDSSGPTFTAPAEVLAPGDATPIVIAGLTDGVVSMTVGGLTVPVDGGAYRATIATATSPIEVVATDELGNTTTTSVHVTATPTPSAYPATNGVHVGQSAWADPVRRAAILELARSGQINAVQLDIKDEVGDLGYPSAVPLATTIGTKMDFFDARAALDELHALGVRVIGRIVCFLDPALARWALANDRADYVVHDGSGTTPLPSADYGDAAFVNFAHPDVQQYQIDLAVEAVRLGFDEILYDYVRRPEDSPAGQTVPLLDTTPEVAVARFVAASAAALKPLGAELGVSVFGISATRPTEIGQDIRLLAPLVDYVSPMVYPETWARGEYGVERPNRQPYDIVVRSLADFQHLTSGSGAAVMPWLQDYTVGSFEYTEAQITAQLDAVRDAGGRSYLMWNPRALYHWPAIVPIVPLVPVEPAP
jgi:hypothetical protein